MALGKNETNHALNVLDEFEPILRIDVTTEIIERIKMLLAQGKLKPGDRLPPERAFAKALGVGRPALRQALKALSTMGVITSQVGAGTYITKSTATVLATHMEFMILMQSASMPELFEMRKTMEVAMAALAAGRASGQEIESINSTLKSQTKHLSNPRAFLVDDLAFHNAIAHAAHNVLFPTILDSLEGLLREARWRLLSDDDCSKSLQDHRAIFQAISRRHAEEARNAMLRHLERVFHRWEEAQHAKLAPSTSFAGVGKLPYMPS